MEAQELVDLICPKHTRTSCNDENLNNGIEIDDGNFRCTRCMLLDLARGNVTPEQFKELNANREFFLSWASA